MPFDPAGGFIFDRRAALSTTAGLRLTAQGLFKSAAVGGSSSHSFQAGAGPPARDGPASGTVDVRTSYRLVRSADRTTRKTSGRKQTGLLLHNFRTLATSEGCELASRYWSERRHSGARANRMGGRGMADAGLPRFPSCPCRAPQRAWPRSLRLACRFLAEHRRARIQENIESCMLPSRATVQGCWAFI